MVEPCPELVFVSGPQEGERAVLIKPVMLAGRSDACDVHLAEESTSREHLRFEMTPEGCQMEVLSSRGVRVNGKSYKPPKKIVLDTGDCIFLGAETNLLFVGAGDDPEEALASYRKANPAARPGAKAREPAPAPAQPLAAPAPATTQAQKEKPAPGLATPQVPAEKEAARQAQARRSRHRKFAVLGVVYTIVLVGLLLFLNSIKKKSVEKGGPPPLLAGYVLVDALRAPLTRGTNENLAAEELRKALAGFDNRNFLPGNLQKVVKGFKLHLAYLNRQEFDDPDSARKFQKANDELIAEVQSIYNEAWLREKGNMWNEAVKEWERLRAILPHDTEWNSAGYKKVVDNVLLHTAYCRANIGKRR